MRPIPILRCLAGMLAPTLPGGTGRDDYVAGTIAMSGANGAVVVEVTNVGDEAVDIQQGDQLTTIEPGATSMFSSDFCGQRLCMANSQILQNGSARAVRPRRRRAARDRSLVPRSRAGSIGIGLFSEGDHTGRMGGRPAVWKPWRRAARSYRQGRSSNANGLRWRVLAPSQQKLSQHLKYIVRARISEFESYHPSHAVRSLRASKRYYIWRLTDRVILCRRSTPERPDA